ncbi:MAG: acetyl-CoA carboxylase biotin carboxyl carrier protein [Oscillospiraceae bacterium]|nr:acetyl-CoA carboxylase biotin carboxyl carrier protein [Oscillospiraceae bacterium]
MNIQELFDYALKAVPDANHIRVRQDEEEIEVSRGFAGAPAQVSYTVPDAAPKPETVKTGCDVVASPLVGVFYASPEPGAEPFVRVGEKVKKGDTLCIVEAMKLFNEIESTYDGTVDEVLAENGAMVEFGQALFSIKTK